MHKIKKHYTLNYDEDIRFKRDNMHKAEFILTLETIRKYLKPNMDILELGAGTGAYSLQLAKEGYKITALELVEHNLELLKSKITSKMDVTPLLGNALNLKKFKNSEFDMVLCLGPMYHLKKKDRLKCLMESIRVCKRGGILIFAFISNHLSLLDNFQKDIKDLMKSKKDYTKELHRKDDVFTLVTIKEIEDLFKETKLQKIELLSPDGPSRLLKSEINKFTKKEFNFWLDYLRKTANDSSLIGYGEHILYVAKK
jgi:ubiquinone/menaquinone biosynthesis C-methylase UbiE